MAEGASGVRRLNVLRFQNGYGYLIQVSYGEISLFAPTLRPVAFSLPCGIIAEPLDMRPK